MKILIPIIKFTLFIEINIGTLYKNNPNTVGNVKIQKYYKDTKSHFFEFLINSIKIGVKSDYDRVYRGNLHQFQCHTV